VGGSGGSGTSLGGGGIASVRRHNYSFLSTYSYESLITGMLLINQQRQLRSRRSFHVDDCVSWRLWIRYAHFFNFLFLIVLVCRQNAGISLRMMVVSPRSTNGLFPESRRSVKNRQWERIQNGQNSCESGLLLRSATLDAGSYFGSMGSRHVSCA